MSTLPLFLVDALPAGDRMRLDGPEGRHAATVKRMRACEAGAGGGLPSAPMSRAVPTGGNSMGMQSTILNKEWTLRSLTACTSTAPVRGRRATRVMEATSKPARRRSMAAPIRP